MSSPPPARPDFANRPAGSWVYILLAGVTAFAFAIVLTFLTLGFVWPFVVGGAIFGIIGLQHLVWGWWFERIYRSGASETADSAPTPPRKADDWTLPVEHR